MFKLKVTTVGNSVGVILPKELMEKFRISKGDTLYVLETPNGFELTPYEVRICPTDGNRRIRDARRAQCFEKAG